MNKRQILLTACLMLIASQQAFAGPNDFFNSSGSNSPVDPNAIGSPLNANPNPPSGDFSVDEKHMQKKYQGSLKHAHELIKEGEDMKSRGEKRHDDKLTKKGKILLEIGQKELNQLQANNPYQALRKNDKAGN